MGLKRTAVLLLGLGAAGGCTAYRTLNNSTVDCSAENAYAFDPNVLPPSNTYPAGDYTADSGITVGPQTIPDGALCGATSALVIQASHNDDWGALAGFWGIGPRDESAYQGVSFWARAPGSSTKGFTLALDDANTYSTTPDAGTNCTNYFPDGGNAVNPTGLVTDPLTGLPLSGVSTAAPPPDACGNSYSAVLAVTADWRFYTVPFTRFHQGAMPSRVPNAALMETGSVPGSSLLTNKLWNIVFRLPREAQIDLWIAKLAFYRDNTGQVVDGDGGVDAAPGM